MTLFAGMILVHEGNETTGNPGMACRGAGGGGHRKK